VKGANLANGNPKGERRAADFYPTPDDVTQALIDTGIIPRSKTIWEPCCGAGDMSRVLVRNGYRVISTDLFDRGYGKGGVDFLATKQLAEPGCAIVTNPPFNLSAKMIEHALELGASAVAVVLKSQYWHASGRTSLFESHRPSYVLPLTWRPDFSGQGGSPTMEVCWSIWTHEMANSTEYFPLRRPARFTGIEDLL
jgi:hypothetical protein